MFSLECASLSSRLSFAQETQALLRTPDWLFRRAGCVNFYHVNTCPTYPFSNRPGDDCYLKSNRLSRVPPRLNLETPPQYLSGERCHNRSYPSCARGYVFEIDTAARAYVTDNFKRQRFIADFRSHFDAARTVIEIVRLHLNINLWTKGLKP